MITRFAIAALMLAAAPASAQTAPALPGWMSGCWTEETGDRWAEECWTAPRGGMMIGSGRAGSGDRLNSWEAMQIIAGADGKVSFFAAPGGVGRTRFEAAGGSATEAVFVNAANDYPQRIRYWREGELLMAEIAMADGAKPIRWRFKRSG